MHIKNRGLKLGLLAGMAAIVVMPAQAKFLQVDPVGYADQMNLYTYVGNDPLNAADPYGKETVFRGGIFQYFQYLGTKEHLSQSDTFSDQFSKLEDSSETYTITISKKAGSKYDPNSRTITWNPKNATVIRSSGENRSSSIGLAEEVVHATGHEEMGTEAFGADGRLDRYTVDDGTVKLNISSVEEERANVVLNEIAKELGEPVRNGYIDSNVRRNCGGTTDRSTC